MTLLVTRPEPQAGEWSEALQAAGVDAQALPLIAIEAPAHAQAIATLWRNLSAHRLLMFVSPAAAEWFFRLRPHDAALPVAATWPAHTLAAAPGPGTAEAVARLAEPLGLRREQLISPDAEGSQFDSEALWPLLAPMAWQGQRVAIVSGGDANGASGRTWLTRQWQDAGADVQAVQAYRRGPGRWNDAQQALARQALSDPRRHVWLFSSSQAIDHLVTAHLPALGGDAVGRWDRAQSRALCTHPRIAETARAIGFGEVHACAPRLPAVVHAGVQAMVPSVVHARRSPP